MDRAQKAKEIQNLHGLLKNSELMILVHNKGITHAQDMELRNKLRAEGGSYKVAKNTLTKLALKGTKFEGLSDKLEGPVGIATSNDPIIAARVVHDFAKTTNDKMVIIGGANDMEVLSLEKIKFLATLPSMDALRGKIVGILQAPGAQLARLANAYATKDQTQA
jgi:large subunit ribosomal protein L10